MIVPLVPPDLPLSDGVITLRAVADRDLEAVGRVFGDPSWMRWFGPGQSAVEHVERVERHWRDGTEAWFAICDVGGDEYLGEVAVRPEAYSRAIGHGERHDHPVRAKNCGRCARWASSSASRSGPAMS